MPELPEQVLGFDFGTKCIGVASGQAITARWAREAMTPLTDSAGEV